MSSRTTRSNSRNQLHIESSSINECGIFNFIETKHDGDCLFTSILDLTSRNREQFKNAPMLASQIRSQSVEYILSRNSAGFQLNWERFYRNIQVNLETRIEDLSKYGDNDKCDDLIKKAYRKYMSTSGNFGTFSELCAAAELYGFMGNIFQHTEANEYRCYEFGSTGNPEIDKRKQLLFLLFTGPTDSGHFRRLEPAIAPKTIQTGNYIQIDSVQPYSQNGSKIIIKRYQSIDKMSTASDPKINVIKQRFPCEMCKQSFETKHDLSVHRNCHKSENTSTDIDTNSSLNEARTSPFTCDVCKKSFPNKRGLTVHQGRHAKEANDKTASQLNARIKGPVISSTKANENAATKSTLDSECNEWKNIFSDFENSEVLDEAAFDEKVESFQKFLFKANKRLPGPQHPSVKFYKLRHQQKNRKLTTAQHSRSSNPQRTDAKAKQRRRDQYQYDLAQYWYYNQRKKAVRMVMTKSGSRQCKIKMDEMQKYIKSIFGTKNDKVLESYPMTDKHPNVTVSEEEIRGQIKKMPMDTSAGIDRVLVKTLRQLNVAKPISSIANTMLHAAYVPNGFRKGMMIFIDKEGDVHSVSNWRPITIFSVIRRIIEKALDSVLRSQININCNQRGFVAGIAGCHINARLVNACLVKAKKFKRNCVAAFLDVSKAYDRIGHLHISKSLKSKGVSENLHDLIMSLVTNNTVELLLGKASSDPIDINCGVAQGAPLSPIIFNIAIDFLYEEICDPEYARNNGFSLSDEYDPLCLSGFADDQAVTSDTQTSAIRTIELVKMLFLKIGLEINPSKSQAIIIENGKLIEDSLRLADGNEIVGVKQNERIKYLGCSFNSELLFDSKSIDILNTNLHTLSTSPILKPDQKLNIINQYIFPTLIYPLQSAPINKIPAYATQGLDVMIRRTVKDIIGLSMRTTDFLFYSPRILRDLGLFRAEWEVYLQHFAIAKKLALVNDGLFQSISNCDAEMNECVQSLNVEGDTSKSLRTALTKNTKDPE